MRSILYSLLKSLVEINQDHHSANYLNASSVFIVMAMQRSSLLFQSDLFADRDYKDFTLKLLSNILNWSTSRKALTLMESEMVITWIFYIIAILHAIMTCLILFLRNKTYISSLLIRQYFAYLHLLFITPSFIIFQIFNHYSQQTITLVIFTPVAFNYLVSVYVQRNYTIPVCNPYHRRYHIYNFIVCLVDIGCLVSLNLVSEQVFTYFMLGFSIIGYIDALLMQPYQISVNKQYCKAISIILSVTIVKLIAFNLDQQHVIYLILLFVPLLTIISTRFLEILYDRQIMSTQLKLPQLLNILDTLLEQSTCQLQSQILLTQLKWQFNLKCKNNKQIVQEYLLELFQLSLGEAKLNNDKEELTLFHLFFLQTQCDKQLLGYIVLKTFEAKTDKQSIYFQIVSEIVSNKMSTISFAKTRYSLNAQFDRLEISDIRKSELLAESCIAQVSVIMDTKVRYWANLQKGYSRIEFLASSSIKLSQLIWKVREEVFKAYNVDPLNLVKQINKFDAMQLKILAMIFSSVLNDYHSTFEVEQRLEEILSFERNLQTDEIINSVVMMDDLFLILVSIIKNKGQIVNQNRSSMALFFGYEGIDDFSSIIYIEQLMPNYVAVEHNRIVDRYIKRGYSHLFAFPNDVYFLMKDGFIRYGKLKLTHIFEKVSDYVITGSVQKCLQSHDFIIFDQNTQLQGMSAGIFAALFEKENITIDQVVKQAYMYFWLPQLISLIQTDREALQKKDNNYQTTDRSLVMYQLRNTQQVIKDHISYRKMTHQMESQREASKASQSAVFAESEQQNENTQNNQMLGVNVNLLTDQFKDNAFEFGNRLAQSNMVQQDNIIQIKFNLQISIIGESRKPIFVLQIQDILKKQSKGSTFATNFQSKSYPNSQAQSINFTPQTSNGSLFADSNFKLKTEEDQASVMNVNPPLRNKLFNYPAFSPRLNLVNEEPIPINILPLDSQLVSPRSNQDNLIKSSIHNEELDEDEQDMKDVDVDQIKSSSNKAPKLEILQILQENRLRVNNNGEKDHWKQSQTSGTSDRTQNSIFSILRGLQYNHHLQTPIINALQNTFMLFAILLILISVELSLMRQNTNSLQAQIPLVRLPDEFNRLYCTFAIIGQIDTAEKLLDFDYGPYYEYRKVNEAKIIRDEMLLILKDIKKSFSSLDDQGKLSPVEADTINEYALITKLTSFTEFNSMVNEHTQNIKYYLETSLEENFIKEEIEVLFLKANIIEQITLAAELVQQIGDGFFVDIDDFQSLYLIFMLIQLTVIFTLIVMQINLWKAPYQYQQNILLLISRVSEQDIETLSLKYSYFQAKITQNSIKWKNINYFREFYNFRISQFRKAQISNEGNKSNKQIKNKGRNKLSSRIQETQFNVFHLYIMLLLLWGLLSVYSVTAFTYQANLVQQSQPEMKLFMVFVQFKADFDAVMILSYLLKTEQQIIDLQIESQMYSRNPDLKGDSEYFKIMYDGMLKQFGKSYDDALVEYSELYSEMVASNKMSADNKALLLGLFEEDICLYGTETIAYCSFNDGKFQYFPNYPTPQEIDNYREIIKYGINGIVNEILSVLKTFYASELMGIQETNQQAIQTFLDSAPFRQVIFSYYFDVNKAILLFYQTILQTSLDILEQDYQNALIYYCSFGILSILILFATIGWRSISLQQQVRAVRQALVVLPHENLLDPQTYNAIKRIERSV